LKIPSGADNAGRPADVASGKISASGTGACYYPTMSERGETDLEMAVRHVAEARRIVEQQRGRIARLKESGKPTFKHEQMLRAFESTLQIFEDDERRIRERLIT
jgi:hypothetical protein